MTQETKTDITPDGTVTLDPLMIRDIENLMLSKQLADAEARLADAGMREAARKKQQCVEAESAIMIKLEKQVGKKLVGKIELLDREKGLCRIT
jgi:hypothetical protein